MSAPRVKVVAQPRGTWLWRCTQHPHVLRAGEGATTARSVPSWEAAMAEGLKHLRDWHPDAVLAAGGSIYSPKVSEKPAQRCEHCWHPVTEHFGRWCRHVTGAIKADGAKRICCCEGADSTDYANTANTTRSDIRADFQLAYSRRCGVPIASCGADTCHCVPVDPDAEKVAQNAACDFGDDFPCCTNPMQATYEGSRADA